LGKNIKTDLGGQGSEDVSSQVVRDKIKC